MMTELTSLIKAHRHRNASRVTLVKHEELADADGPAIQFSVGLPLQQIGVDLTDAVLGAEYLHLHHARLVNRGSDSSSLPRTGSWAHQG